MIKMIDESVSWLNLSRELWLIALIMTSAVFLSYMKK